MMNTTENAPTPTTEAKEGPKVLLKNDHDGHGEGLKKISSRDVSVAEFQTSKPVAFERTVPLSVQRRVCEIEIGTLSRLQCCLIKFKSAFDVLVDFTAAFFIDVIELVAVIVFIAQKWLLNKEREKRSLLIGLSDSKLAELENNITETAGIRKRNERALDHINNELKKEAKEPIQSAHEAMLEELKIKCQEQINPELLLPSETTALEDMEPSSGTDIELRGWAAVLLDHIRDNTTFNDSRESKMYGFQRIGDNRRHSGHSRYQLRKYTSFIY